MTGAQEPRLATEAWAHAVSRQCGFPDHTRMLQDTLPGRAALIPKRPEELCMCNVAARRWSLAAIACTGTYLGVVEGKAPCSGQEEEGTADRQIKR